jgi:hypothetical protein
MKKLIKGIAIQIIILLLFSACLSAKPLNIQSGKNIENRNNSNLTPAISPVVPENGTAILIYQQETRQEPAFSEVVRIEIPIQMLPSKGESRDMRGSKDGDMHLAMAPKGAVVCHMFFTLRINITAQGVFDPKKCAFNIVVIGVPGKVTERTGNCPYNPEKLFTDSMVQAHYIPPPNDSYELKGATLSTGLKTIATDTTLILTLKDVYLPNVVSCQW